MLQKNVIKLGLIKGRHPLPVEKYILKESEIKAFTKKELQPLIEKSLEGLGIKKYYSFLDECLLSFWDKENNEINIDDIPQIQLYITGLTIVTLVTLELLNKWCYDVEIIGFNPNTKEYYSQGLFKKKRGNL
ncbi:hypothetical protein [Clostridium botulinum]|uniref:hypothetical protein n=3 Tax=Clostridium botulinum TaxID=1491 RepID=UPI0004D00E24|nr:hypothetical protein [Clostridium botulinum]APC82219.1 hypothetical protein NPD12_3718 [Clostridium botulinum]AXG97781.1 hypothetical protein AGE31_19525 [Clostridium botulinum]MBY6773574.1 hypothetical protein [Clostridium botulinum]MBY6886007.1 hypothetical protein [Clostridium botulinum]